MLLPSKLQPGNKVRPRRNAGRNRPRDGTEADKRRGEFLLLLCRELGLCGWRCDETGEAVVAREDTGEEEDATKHFEMVLYEWRVEFETAGCFRMDLEDRHRQLISAICVFLFTQIQVLH
jgi:hypothetical protein